MRPYAVPVFLLLALCSLACDSSPSPQPPQPKPPLTRQVQATVLGPSTVNATLVTDDGITHPCGGVVLAAATRVVCELHPDTPAPYGAHLTVAAALHVTRTIDFALKTFTPTDQIQDLPEITLAPIPVALPRLTIAGVFLRKGDAPFTAVMATDFNLYARYLAGEDISPVLEQRAALGFNMLRVWTAYDVCPNGTWPNNGQPCQPIGRLTPKEHPDFYTRLPDFLQRLARHNLYAEIVAFTGEWGTTLPTDDDKITHWARLTAALQSSTNVIVEMVNEHDHAANRALVPLYGRLPRPAPPLLASHGSGQADSSPLLPVWDYATYHPGFGPEWPRKAAHNGMEDVSNPHRVPVLLNETTRAPDSDSNPAHFEDAAKGSALLQAGICFHSVEGKHSRLFTGITLELARAFVRGAHSVPLHCQNGGYRRRDDLLTPALLRVYQRGTDAACIVEIRKSLSAEGLSVLFRPGVSTST